MYSLFKEPHYTYMPIIRNVSIQVCDFCFARKTESDELKVFQVACALFWFWLDNQKLAWVLWLVLDLGVPEGLAYLKYD